MESKNDEKFRGYLLEAKKEAEKVLEGIKDASQWSTLLESIDKDKALGLKEIEKLMVFVYSNLANLDEKNGDTSYRAYLLMLGMIDMIFKVFVSHPRELIILDRMLVSLSKAIQDGFTVETFDQINSVVMSELHEEGEEKVTLH